MVTYALTTLAIIALAPSLLILVATITVGLDALAQRDIKPGAILTAAGSLGLALLMTGFLWLADEGRAGHATHCGPGTEYREDQRSWWCEKA